MWGDCVEGMGSLSGMWVGCIEGVGRLYGECGETVLGCGEAVLRVWADHM